MLKTVCDEQGLQKESTLSCEMKSDENNNITIKIGIALFQESTLYLKVDTGKKSRSCCCYIFTKESSNSFSYQLLLEKFEDTCNGVREKLYDKEIKDNNGTLFQILDEVRVKRAILIATSKLMDCYERKKRNMRTI